MGPTTDPRTNSKFNDGRIGFRKLPIRSQETLFRWNYDPDGNLIGLYQIAAPDYVMRYIPLEKALLFRTKSHKNNPEGRSMLRNSYRSYYFKTKIEEIEGIGIERDLAGLPVAKVPASLLSPTASPAEKAVLSSIQTLVTKLKRDELEGVVFPASETPEGKKTGYDLSLMSTGSRRQFDTNVIIERYEKRIAMTCLADFIFLGQTGVGSLALSSDKTEMFSLAIGTILDTICETLNNKAIPLLFSLNSFSGLTKLPKLIHEDIETPDLLELGTYMYNLAGAGATLFPNEELEDKLMEAANLPKKSLKAAQAQAAIQEDAKASAEAQAQAKLQPKVDTQEIKKKNQRIRTI